MWTILVILNYNFNCFNGIFLSKSLFACMKLELSAIVVRSIIRQAIPGKGVGDLKPHVWYCNLYNIWECQEMHIRIVVGET
jgi:hypothetical protein